MRLSEYKDVELALLYWIKDMRSRDHRPPLSKGILKAKAEQEVHYIVFDGHLLCHSRQMIHIQVHIF